VLQVAVQEKKEERTRDMGRTITQPALSKNHGPGHAIKSTHKVAAVRPTAHAAEVRRSSEHHPHAMPPPPRPRRRRRAIAGEPPPGLFPARDDLLRLLAVLSIAVATVTVCSHLNRRPQPFCDSHATDYGGKPFFSRAFRFPCAAVI
jgi:hypothetical protein